MLRRGQDLLPERIQFDHLRSANLLVLVTVPICQSTTEKTE